MSSEKSSISLAIHLKPVNTILFSTLYDSASLLIIGVETIVVAINSSPLILSSDFHFFNKKATIITMVWLPLSNCILPSEFRTATPNLSQSGSVPITISAFSFSASSKAIFSAAGSSGFGEATVGKSPSGFSCSFTKWTFL